MPEQDPILRYGGMYVLGLAYRGTANNAAIQKLLGFAVSDVSDDVRRAAVLCLGFVLMGAPEQCPRIVALLAESFNPHVRYGAAMAVGLACAGSGLKDAVALLEPLLADPTDFVRQVGGYGAPAHAWAQPMHAAISAPPAAHPLQHPTSMLPGQLRLLLACTLTTPHLTLIVFISSHLTSSHLISCARVCTHAGRCVQGALISLALVLVGQPEARVAPLRKRIDKFVGEKHEEVRAGEGAGAGGGLCAHCLWRRCVERQGHACYTHKRNGRPTAGHIYAPWRKPCYVSGEVLRRTSPCVPAAARMLECMLGRCAWPLVHAWPRMQVMCKMGAIMAAGILDAGGRNVVVALRSRSGYFRRTSVLGLALFTQYW